MVQATKSLGDHQECDSSAIRIDPLPLHDIQESNRNWYTNHQAHVVRVPTRSEHLRSGLAVHVG